MTKPEELKTEELKTEQPYVEPKKDQYFLVRLGKDGELDIKKPPVNRKTPQPKKENVYLFLGRDGNDIVPLEKKGRISLVKEYTVE